MTKEEAKKLCILKWEYIVGHDGHDYGIYNVIPQLEDLESDCAYCELYLHNDCMGCPIRPNKYDSNRAGCWQSGHPFNIWFHNRDSETAQAVLDLIKNS